MEQRDGEGVPEGQRLYLNHRYGGTVFDDVIEDEGLKRALADGILSGREAHEIQRWLRPGKVDTGPDAWAVAAAATIIALGAAVGFNLMHSTTGLTWSLVVALCAFSSAVVYWMGGASD